MALLPVSEALQRLTADATRLGSERVSLEHAAGRILAEDIVALRTQPPFPASAMDGYAVRAIDVAVTGARLTVIGQAAAGHPFEGAVGENETVRIFTGAPVPAGADTVLIQEDARVLDNGSIETTATVQTGRHVRAAGLDFKEGDVVLRSGRVLDAAALALCAAANHASVSVARRPLVAILATGDELVPPGNETGPGQIIASNSYAIAALVRNAGAVSLDLGIVRDDRGDIAAALHKARDTGADVIVTLGGASVGDHDLVQSVFRDEGMTLDFWKIAMRPGKPLMFGTLGDMRILGLPGNPVSSIVCAHLFLVPLVRALQGAVHQPDVRQAILAAPMAANDSREDYVRAEFVRLENGTLSVKPFNVQDSSMLSAMAGANALIIRPPHAPEAGSGDMVEILVLRQ